MFERMFANRKHLVRLKTLIFVLFFLAACRHGQSGHFYREPSAEEVKDMKSWNLDFFLDTEIKEKIDSSPSLGSDPVPSPYVPDGSSILDDDYLTLGIPVTFKSLRPFVRSEKEIESELSAVKEMPKRPPIIIIMSDTTRNDYITEKVAPHLSDFRKESWAPMTFSAGGVTALSTFSLYHGISPYWMVDRGRKQENLGSPYLKVAAKLGYKFKVFSKQEWYPCLDSNNPITDTSDYWLPILQLNYNMYESMVDQCHNNRGIGSSMYFKDGQVFDVGLTDRKILYDAFQEIKKDQASGNVQNIYFIHLQNVHGPFDFSATSDAYFKPTCFHCESELSIEIGRNAYANAVRGLDLDFKIFIDKLKSIDLYDESIVVFTADHGKYLGYRKSREFGHWGLVVWETTNIPMFIKLSKNYPEKNMHAQTASLYDLYPSIFSSLAAETFSKKLLGQSIFSDEHTSSLVSTQSNRNSYSTKLAFVSKNYRAYVTLNAENPWDVSGFTIDRFGTVKDGLIPEFDLKNGDKAKIQKKVLAKFKSEFGSLLDKMIVSK